MEVQSLYPTKDQAPDCVATQNTTSTAARDVMMLFALGFASSFALTFGLNAPYTGSHGVTQ
jgi:hypothetical protein